MIKGGFIAWAQMGDANASIPTPQPLHHAADVRRARARRGATSLAFVSPARAGGGHAWRGWGSTSGSSAVRGCRGLGKRDMKLNDALPQHQVDPETYEVRADGELLRCEPARTLPLAQRYCLF